jgi:hypothetical protein
VMYPPTPEETHCITINQIAVVIANVVAVAPWPGQGEISANPSPEPSASSTKETDAATNAPAMIAGHDAADAAGASSERAPIGCSMALTRSTVRTHGEQQNDRQGNTQHPK